MSLNLASIIRVHARNTPEQIAVSLGDTRLSYAQLDAAARRLAGGLEGLGVTAGQHVALLVPNVPAFSVAYFGCHYAACPVVPVSVLATAHELAHILHDADVQAVIVWERMLPAVQEAVQIAGLSVKVLVARADLGDVSAPQGTYSMNAVMDAATPVEVLPATMPDDTAVLLYTSGTTGAPKAAELTHFNLYYNAETVARRVLPLTRDTITLVCLPLSHSFAQTILHNASLCAGGQVVLMPRFEPVTALSLIQSQRVSFFGGVPMMYMALLQAASTGDYDLSSLKWAVGGGSPVPVEIMRAFDARFGVSLLEGYGLSETSPAASFNMLDLPKQPGSIGVPLHGVEFRLERLDGSVVTGLGEPGEICIRGVNVMKGYYKRPEETAEAFRGGWFHTGDVGVVDEHGYYRIVDRIKDMILYGGYNVYPREVEEVLYAHPAVAEAAVIGVPSPTQGEDIKAYIVLKPGASANEQDLITHCRERLAVYKYPRSVEFRDSLPKGPTGKILKKALREPAAGDAGH